VVDVTSRQKLDWRVPSDEWDAFVDFVYHQHGEIKGYVGREVERAMREWIDVDDFATVEDQIDRLIRAAGRRYTDLSQKKSASDTLESEDTTRVACRVDSHLKQEFSGFVKKMTDDRLGVALAWALRERRAGGRSQRVENKLERIIDDAEALLAEINGNNELSIRKKRTITICNQLSDQFLRDELESAIAEIAGDSPPTLQDYTHKVLNRLGVVEHPDRPDLYITKNRARQLGIDLDAPQIDWKPYEALTREEKVEGVRIELARLAKVHHGKYQIEANTIKQKICNSKPSDNETKEILRQAATADGFDVTHYRGKDKLRINLACVTDPEVLNVISGDAKTVQSPSTARHTNASKSVSGLLNDG